MLHFTRLPVNYFTITKQSSSNCLSRDPVNEYRFLLIESDLEETEEQTVIDIDRNEDELADLDLKIV